MSSRVHVDFSHDTFLRRRRSHGHCLGPAHLALARANEVARAGNQVAECEALFDDLFVDAEGFGDRANLAASLRHCAVGFRSEEHTSELQSLMRIAYAVFYLKK